MLAYYTITRKMDETKLLCCMVLFIRFCGVLCQQCGDPYKANVNNYVENSFLSLEVENKTLTLLTVHSDDVYAAGNNGLFHLSQNLELESKHVTEGEENIYKILQVSESLGKLVACGSGGNRGCQLRSLDDVSVNSSSTNAYFHENIVASGEYRTVGEIAPGKSGGSSLYVARCINLNGIDGVNRPVFERELMSNGNADRQTNFITSYVQNSFVIYYSDVFSYDGFVYFLASQRDDPTRDSPIVSKLSRICQNDESSDFKAFAEIQLACKAEGGSPYSVTQSAQRIGNDLYIVFNKNGDITHEYNPQPQSALCVYNMTEIEETFAANSNACACNLGSSDANRNINYLSRASCGLLFEQFEEEDFTGCGTLGIEDLKGKFTCAGEIGSTRFFAYPQGPVKQKVAAETLYEDNFTFTSVSVTSVSRDDSQRIAFIGTKEGKLLKVNLGKRACPNYEVVHVGSPILGDTTFFNNTESLLVLTKAKVLKIRVADCSQFTTCDECIRPGSSLGDPHCGWCTLERRCTREDNCTSYDDITRWLPHNASHCPAIEVTPKSLLIDNHSRTLQLKITNLPDLNDEELYECHFNDWSTKANVTADVIKCTSPPLTEIPVVVVGDHVTMRLGVFSSETRKVFLTKDYEFVDCTRIKSCSKCVRRKCDWCKFQHRCIHDSSRCRKAINGSVGYPANTSAESCPQILSTDKKLVPNGVEHSFQFPAKNLPPLEDENVLYSYMKNQQTLETKLSPKWITNNEVEKYQEVQLYKCEVNRPDCSRCLSPATTPANLRCVWCENTCTVEGTCNGQPTLPGTGTCPAPRIDTVDPATSTVGGGTHVTITGSNLGQTFQDIDRIILAGETCTPLEHSYRVGESIKCEAGPATEVIDSGDILVQVGDKSGTKPNCFSYKDPIIRTFEPSEGPQSGGTRIEIEGSDLDTGGFVNVTIGDVTCKLLSTPAADNITCRTEAAESIFEAKINVTFDETESKISGRNFSFKEDPKVESVEPHNTIMSGGTNLIVTGTSFGLIQEPRIVATTKDGIESYKPCLMESGTLLRCPTPKVNLDGARERRQTETTPGEKNVVIGFLLDGVNLKNWTEDNGIAFQYVEDPSYEPFVNNEMVFNQGSQETIQIRGKNIDIATMQEDVTVYIGEVECEITVFDEDQIYCKPPSEQPAAGDINGNRIKKGLPYVVVNHGNNLRFNLGYLRYSTDPIIFIILGIVLLLLLIVCIPALIIHRIWRSNTKELELLFLELRDVSNISEDLRIFYDTLQTALDKFETTKGRKQLLKMANKSLYVTNVLFNESAMAINSLEGLEMEMLLKDAMKTFSELIQEKNFLSATVQVVDDDISISEEQRATIASLILVSSLLEGNIEFITHMMKELISERIERADHVCSKELFRRDKRIVEHFFHNLISLCLYECLNRETAEKILQLYWAIKSIIEAGPVDAVTGKTQFSLSLPHMLKDQIKFEEMKVRVLFAEECDEVIEMNFLSVDSITQVKSKILEYLRQNKCTRLKYLPEELDLVLWNNDGERIILRDNSILKLKNGWRKINMLSDFELQEGESLELVKRVYERKPQLSLNATSDEPVTADQYLDMQVGYLILDPDQDDAGVSEMNTSQEQNDGYMIPDAHQATGNDSTPTDQHLEMQAGYLILDSDQD